MKKIITILSFLFLWFENVYGDSNILPIKEGNVDAKVKIIVYESLTCSHCANFHKNVYPNLKRDFIDTDKIYIEFRNFPLDLAAFNASKIAHCKNDGKPTLLHLLYENQEEWVKGQSIDEFNKNLKKFVKKNQKEIDFEKCIANKDIENHVLNDRIEGVKKFNIDATPTLIINDKKFDNPQNYKKLKKTIEKLI